MFAKVLWQRPNFPSDALERPGAAVGEAHNGMGRVRDVMF